MIERQKTQKLERMLIVNDDIEDIIAMQVRLPESIEVESTSQFSARYIEENGYDVIIVDNDANNLQESKGQETIQELKKKFPEVPIIYTSFQPGWVDKSVSTLQGVKVVRTDLALKEIANRFKIKLKEKQRRNQDKPNLHILMSYNPIGNYTKGLYQAENGDNVLIINYPKHAQDRAKEVISEHVKKIYGDFNWRTDRHLIKNIFVYDGINGGEWPGRVAQALGHDVRMRVNLMACSCDWDRKSRLRDSSHVDLYQVGCGGETEMGMIADVLLGIRRPRVRYDRLPISIEKIKQGIQKFEM